MLGQGRRRWTNIQTNLGKCLLIAKGGGGGATSLFNNKYVMIQKTRDLEPIAI